MNLDGTWSNPSPHAVGQINVVSHRLLAYIVAELDDPGQILAPYERIVETKVK